MALPKILLVAVLAALTTLSGCASPRVLAPSPGQHSTPYVYPEGVIADRFRAPRADLIFVTDRVRDEETNSYIAQRSRSMAAGRVVVEIGQGASWQDLMDLAGGTAPRGRPPQLFLSETEQLVVFPDTPIPYRLVDGAVVEQEDVAAEYQAAREGFQDLIRMRLDEAGVDTVLLHVHGFNTGFEAAAYNLTDIWHYSGRGSVPVFFSWPTREGSLFGYFSARESGEFSVFHLKETFRALQGIDELRAINVVAHSRGVDVTTTALRELIIEARGAGQSAREVLKVDNLILAAADLDVAVAGQRLGAERIALAIGQITLYSNPEDAALRLSSLVSSGLRVGRSTSVTHESNFGDSFLEIENVAFIDVSGLRGDLGHNYFRLNPGVIADIAMVLQSGARPGDPARRLTRINGNFYRLGER